MDNDPFSTESKSIIIDGSTNLSSTLGASIITGSLSSGATRNAGVKGIVAVPVPLVVTSAVERLTSLLIVK